MPEFIINHIDPSTENASVIVKLKSNELKRNGIPLSRVNEIANPNDKSHIENQLKRLQDYPERYLGAIALNSGDLVGYSNTSEWTARDQFPFSHGVERFALAAMINFLGNRLQGEPLGIHELVIGGEENERNKIVDVLLNRAIEVAESREIRIAQCNDKTIFPSLGEYGFESTKKHAAFPDGLKLLCVRPPYVPEYSEIIEAYYDEYFPSNK